MEALYHEVTAQRALERSFEDMVREINHLIAQMTDDELRSYLAESLFLNTVKYENDRLEAYMRKLERRRVAPAGAKHDRRDAVDRVGGPELHVPPDRPEPPSPMSLNYLATRFTCSWPWSTMVMLCDGRIVCGCADPYGKRVLGDARTATVSGIWTGERRVGAPARSERRRVEVLRRLPAQAAAEDATRRRRSATSTSARCPPPVRRVHGRLQHLLQPGLLRPRDRASRAPGRRACSTSTCSRA